MKKLLFVMFVESTYNGYDNQHNKHPTETSFKGYVEVTLKQVEDYLKRGWGSI